MRLKRIEIIGVFIIFILGFLSHSVYDKYPSDLTAVLFPINESIWEHLKLLFYTAIFYGFIEYFFVIDKTNYLFAKSAAAFSMPLIFLLLYLPIEYIMGGHNFVVTVIIFFVSILLGQVISYRILTSRINFNVSNWIFIIVVLIVFTIFTYFTYYPPHTKLFYDEKTGTYGVQETS